jgi:hypothetical protein
VAFPYDRFIGAEENDTSFVHAESTRKFFASLKKPENKVLRKFFLSQFLEGLEAKDKDASERIITELTNAPELFLFPLFPKMSAKLQEEVLKIEFMNDLWSRQLGLNQFVEGHTNKKYCYESAIENLLEKGVIFLANQMYLVKDKKWRITKINFELPSQHWRKGHVVRLFKIAPEFIELWIKTEKKHNMLELIVYHVLQERFGNDWDLALNVLVKDQQNEFKGHCAELDIVMKRKSDNVIVLIECKSEAKPSDVMKFWGKMKLLKVPKGVVVSGAGAAPAGILSKLTGEIGFVSNIYDNMVEFEKKLFETVERLTKG